MEWECWNRKNAFIFSMINELMTLHECRIYIQSQFYDTATALSSLPTSSLFLGQVVVMQPEILRELHSRIVLLESNHNFLNTESSHQLIKTGACRPVSSGRVGVSEITCWECP